jgi:glutamate-5-semialdehyde dehydrogenase
VLENVFKSVRDGSRKLPLLAEEKINAILIDLADRAIENIPLIIRENVKDLARMAESDPKYDRLKLTEERIRDIAKDLHSVSALPSPLGITLEKKTLENGLNLEKITVPLGVVGIIYESRPNVTFDVFSLCLKSGNACILKGGSDAEFSNKIIVDLIKSVLKKNEINPDIIALLPSDRSATQ